MTERDRLRRARVEELVDEGGVVSGADYFHAAIVFQHGSSLDSFRRALGRSQRFGTQFQAIGGRWQLLLVNPETTDEERVGCI